jgi:rhamnose utilization protein RhaD (predicted bifunctional aldolase and dehydrogenase)
MQVIRQPAKNALLNARVDPGSGLRPSVETSLHNLFSYRFVVHTHMTLVNGLMCSNQAEQKTLEIFGEDVLYVPYSDPGYILFKIIAEKIEEYNIKFNCDPKIVLIQNHGIFVAADSVEEIHEIYTEVMSKLKSTFSLFPASEKLPVSEKIIQILPAVRMLVTEDKLKVVTAFNSSWIANYISSNESFNKGIARPFNPDQMVYCMSEYLFIENSNSTETIIEEVKIKIADFKNRKGAVPKVIFVQNEGLIVAEDSPFSRLSEKHCKRFLPNQQTLRKFWRTAPDDTRTGCFY